MVGRDIGDTYANLRRNDKIGGVILEVKNLVTEYVHDVSFKLRRGEVLGFAGLMAPAEPRLCGRYSELTRSSLVRCGWRQSRKL
jgi:ABC-type sugar transport system ATPase subunit